MRQSLAGLNDQLNVVLGNAADADILRTLVSDTDHVVYALGSSSPAESELDPAGDVTLVLPPLIRLLEVLRQKPDTSLLFLSSGGAVYGNSSERYLTEDVAPAPISSYGILKVTSEDYVQMYARRFGIDIKILRVANAYGPGQSWSGSQGVVAHLMRSALTGESIVLYGPSDCVRDFIYIDDVAHVVVDLVNRRNTSPVINIGSGVGHSIQDVRRMIEQVSGKEIRAQELPARRFDVRRNVLDCELLHSLTDFHPIDLEDGVIRTWEGLTDQRSIATAGGLEGSSALPGRRSQ
jgi:UDP-glucose 4-epimerase